MLAICAILTASPAGARLFPSEAVGPALLGLSLVELLAGFALYRWLTSGGLRGALRGALAARGGVSLRLHPVIAAIALLALLASIALVVVLTNPDLRIAATDLPAIARAAAYYIVLVGLAEELLFRGLCFEAIDEPIGAVLGSSLLFALYHISNGALFLPYYASIGVLLGVMRIHGLPLWALAIGHGLFDVAVGVVLPPTGIEPAASVVAPLGLLTITAASGWAFHAFEERVRASRRAEIREGAGLPKRFTPKSAFQQPTQPATGGT
jgi:membrane protease YdiL (CAAX protease family)